MKMNHVLARKGGFELVVGILMFQGAMCPKCGFGTQVTSKRWAKCKRCGERVERKEFPVSRRSQTAEERGVHAASVAPDAAILKRAEARAPFPEEWEELIQNCVAIFKAEGKASVVLLQRRLRLGYTRALLLMDECERRGLVGPARGAEPREVLVE